jgi:hypothetical protein
VLRRWACVLYAVESNILCISELSLLCVVVVWIVVDLLLYFCCVIWHVLGLMCHHVLIVLILCCYVCSQ